MVTDGTTIPSSIPSAAQMKTLELLPSARVVTTPNSKVEVFLREQPVTWKPSQDSRRLIGHMILKKTLQDGVSSDSGAILGLKVIGGEMTPSGRLAAFITKVKRGSIADVVGHLKPGDEVIEWNGRCLKNLSASEVAEIVMDSKQDPQVELIVQRSLDETYNVGLNYKNRYKNEYDSDCSTNVSSYGGGGGGRERHTNITPVMPNTMDSHIIDRPQAKIQLKLLYEPESSQIVVTIMSARDLIPQFSNPSQFCNSYCKLCVIPEKNETTRQRTRVCMDSNNPKWNEILTFSPYKDHEIRNGVDLEVTVWDYDRQSERSELIGEVLIDLNRANLVNVPQWYPINMVGRGEFGHDMDTPTPMRMRENDANPGRYLENLYTSRSELPGLHHEDPNDPYSAQMKMRMYSQTAMNLPGDQRRYSGDSRGMRSSEQSRFAGHPDQFDYSSVRERRGSGPQWRDDRTETSSLRGGFVSDTGEAWRSHRQGPGGHRRPHADPDRYREGKRRPYHRPDYMEEDVENQSDVSETSDISEVSKVSLRSTQSERPVKRLSEFKNNMEQRLPGNIVTRRKAQGLQIAAAAGPVSNNDQGDLKTGESSGSTPNAEGISSDGNSSAVSSAEERKRRPSFGQKFTSVLGLSRKTSSSSNLEKKPKTSFQRSEEVLPAHIRQNNTPQPGSNTPYILASDNPQPGADPTADSSVVLPSSFGPDSNSPSNRRTSNLENMKRQKSNEILEPMDEIPQEKNQICVNDPNDEVHVNEFVEGLGPGQVVGRQVLGMSCLGEIQLSFIDRKGHLEVEVIRARNLQPKNLQGKTLPQPYVKLYLIEGKAVIERQRTPTSSRKTLDPLYQQQIIFNSSYQGKVLQVAVWGDYGRIDKKYFMGMCEILLNDLDLSSIVFGWYKLYAMIAAVHHQNHKRKSSGGGSSNEAESGSR